MAGIATDATGISSLQSGLETPDVALNLRKQGDSIVSGRSWARDYRAGLIQAGATTLMQQDEISGMHRACGCSCCGLVRERVQEGIRSRNSRLMSEACQHVC